MAYQIPEGWEVVEDVEPAIPEGWEVVGRDETVSAKNAALQTERFGSMAADEIPVLGQVESQAPPMEQAERDIGDVLTGVGETALTAATGATGGTAGYISGVLRGLEKFARGEATAEDVARMAAEQAANFTYMPRSEAGQEYTQAVGEVAGALPPVLGAAPMQSVQTATALPKLSQAVKKAAQRPAAKEIVRLIEAGEIDPKTVGFDAIEGIAVKNPIERKLINSGITDTTLATVKVFTPEEKARGRQMVKITQAIKKDPTRIDHPTDVIGESLQARIKNIYRANEDAGRRVNVAAKALKGQPYDIGPAAGEFLKTLRDDLRIKFNADFEPVFTDSPVKANATSRNAIKTAVAEMKRVYAKGDAQAAHDFKKMLSELVDYSGRDQSGVKGEAQTKLKGLRKSISDDLNSKFEDYGAANKDYSDTIRVLKELQRIGGSSTDLTDDMAKIKLGKLANRVLTSYPSKGDLMKALKAAEDISNRFGGQHDDNLIRLAVLADELETRFKVAPKRSYQSGVEKGVTAAKEAAKAVTSPVDAAGKIVEAATKPRTPDETEVFKMLEELLQ